MPTETPSRATPPAGLDVLPSLRDTSDPPDGASAGEKAGATTRALTLVAAGILGTAVVVGLPLLFRQQQLVSNLLPGAGSELDSAFRALTEVYWMALLALVAAGAGLTYAVLRMLAHAKTQAAVRREVQSMLLRAERARIDADQANADKSRFLAEAGHDLRTPLTTILGYGELIERELMGPIGRIVYRQAAGHIVHAGRELTQRIADIIELARVEGSIARPAEHPTPVSTMVRETHAWAVTSFAPKRLTIGLRLPETPVGLKVQPLLLRRMVRGLIADAAERTPAGGAIILSVGFGGDGRLDIAVRDTGGMPTLTAIGPGGRTLERRPAFVARGEEGGDLGLMIVRALMQSIGGHMDVVDTAGRGSEIHLLFPRHLVVRDEWRLRRRQIVE
jgi:two-component system cell cycle sensor histidine kinase PleC